MLWAMNKQKKPQREASEEEIREALKRYARIIVKIAEAVREQEGGQDFLDELTGREKGSTIERST